MAFKYCSTPQYYEYADRVVENCRALSDELKLLGNKIVTDGTDTNILLWDIKNYGYSADTLLDLGEACNLIFSGCTSPQGKKMGYPGQDLIRFGTNVVTARDYQPEDMRQVARYIHELAQIGLSIQKSEDAVWQETFRIQEMAEEVENFAVKFPLPGITSNYIF